MLTVLKISQFYYYQWKEDIKKGPSDIKGSSFLEFPYS